MGERSIIEVRCPECGFVDHTWCFDCELGLVEWVCPKCDYVLDLMGDTKVEDYSNAGAMEALCRVFEK